MEDSPFSLFWWTERHNAHTYIQEGRLAAYRHYPLKMMAANFKSLTQSFNLSNAEGEQHRDPDHNEDFSDSDIYLDFLRQVTHYPDDYHHGSSAAVDTLLPIQNNPALSHMGDGFIGAVLDFERPSLCLGLSNNRQDLSEGAALTSGLSPPSQPRPLYDVHDFPSTTESLDALLELPLFAGDQVRTHTSCQNRSSH